MEMSGSPTYTIPPTNVGWVGLAKGELERTRSVSVNNRMQADPNPGQ